MSLYLFRADLTLLLELTHTLPEDIKLIWPRSCSTTYPLQVLQSCSPSDFEPDSPVRPVPFSPSIVRQLYSAITRLLPSNFPLLVLLWDLREDWEIWLGWFIVNQDRSSNNLCVQHTRRHHMDGCMHAHTMNTNMNNCLKEDKAFLQFNWNPRLQSQLPHHHLWLISQIFPSSSLHISVQNLSCFQPSLPLLQFLPSHTESSSQT